MWKERELNINKLNLDFSTSNLSQQVKKVLGALESIIQQLDKEIYNENGDISAAFQWCTNTIKKLNSTAPNGGKRNEFFVMKKDTLTTSLELTTKENQLNDHQWLSSSKRKKKLEFGRLIGSRSVSTPAQLTNISRSHSSPSPTFSHYAVESNTIGDESEASNEESCTNPAQFIQHSEFIAKLNLIFSHIEALKSLYPIKDLIEWTNNTVGEGSTKFVTEKLEELKNALKEEKKLMQTSIESIQKVSHCLFLSKKQLNYLKKSLNHSINERLFETGIAPQGTKEDSFEQANETLKELSKMIGEEIGSSKYPICNELSKMQTTQWKLSYETIELESITIDELVDIILLPSDIPPRLIQSIKRTFLMTMIYYVKPVDLLEKIVVRFCLAPAAVPFTGNRNSANIRSEDLLNNLMQKYDQKIEKNIEPTEENREQVVPPVNQFEIHEKLVKKPPPVPPRKKSKLEEESIFKLKNYERVRTYIQEPARLSVIRFIRSWINMFYQRDFSCHPEVENRLRLFITNTVGVSGLVMDARNIIADLQRAKVRLHNDLNSLTPPSKSPILSARNTKRSLTQAPLSPLLRPHESIRTDPTTIPPPPSVPPPVTAKTDIEKEREEKEKEEVIKSNKSFIMLENDLNIIMTNSPTEIALQLTYFEFHTFYSQIEISELLLQNWNSNQRNINAPKIVGMIDHFNCVSTWIVRSILHYESAEDRAKVIKKMIIVLLYLLKLNNINGVIEITCALTNTAIDRLNKTWRLVGKNLKYIIELLNRLFMNKMSIYRRLWNECQPPCIPYIGLTLTDLTFLEDGNKSFLDAQKTILNFRKFNKISNVIDLCLKSQTIPYDIDPMDNYVHFFTHFKSKNNFQSAEDAWFQRSKYLEPPLQSSDSFDSPNLSFAPAPSPSAPSPASPNNDDKYSFDLDLLSIDDILNQIYLLRDHPLLKNINANTAGQMDELLFGTDSPFLLDLSQVIDKNLLGRESSPHPLSSRSEELLKNFSSVELHKMLELMKSEIFTCNRRYHMKLYKDTFIGREAVNWMIDYNSYFNRQTAIEVGQLLCEQGYISRVSSNKCKFKDTDTIYKFSDPADTSSTDGHIFSKKPILERFYSQKIKS